MTRTLTLAALLIVAPGAAYAQTALLPGQVIEFDLATTGVRRVGTTTATEPRPESAVAFEYRIDASPATVPAVKHAPCVVTTAPAVRCRLVPPALTPGAHTIHIRALPSPSEAGVDPSAFTPFDVAVVLVSGPAAPANPRIVTP